MSQITNPQQLAQAAAPTPAKTIATPTDFAHALLQYMGLPDTSQNVEALVAWAAAEGGNWNNTASFNPFNTTLGMPGSRVMAGGNTAGVQAYTSWQQGLAATAQTLQGGAYRGIIAALRQGNDPGAVANAVVNSPWGTHTISLASAGTYANTTGGPSGGVYTTGGPAGGGVPQDQPYNPSQQYAIDPSAQQWITQNAGQDAWMLSDPELSNILGYVAKNQITDRDEVHALVAQTNWYKSHNDRQRAWAQTYASDPAAAQAAIHDAQKLIEEKAGQLGIKLSQDQLNTLSIDYNYYGFTSQELDAAIGQYSTTKTPSANLTQLQQSANNYLVNISDPTMQQWLTQINSRVSTVDQFNAYLQQQAISKYPWMQQAITAGQTPAQVLDPYKQEIASTLQIDPNLVNFNDARWSKLTYTTDPKTGMQVQIPLWQSQQMVKQDPTYGWGATPDAKNQAFDTAKQLEQIMGSIA